MTTILLIDSCKGTQFGVEQLLAMHNYQIKVADFSQPLLKVYQQTQPQLILLNLQWQLESSEAELSFELLATVKQDGDIAVIGLSNWNNIEVIDKAFSFGIDTILPKPWHNRQLLHCIEYQLATIGAKIPKYRAAKNSDLPLMTLQEAEIELIKLAMDKAEHNVPKAATLLGLSKAAMYRRLEKYDIAKH